jgi:RHS repeat-associated protein
MACAAFALMALVLVCFAVRLKAADDVAGTFNEGGSSINADADPATGSLQYRFPFALAPGRGNAKPTLGLIYNSGAGDGDAGLGWRLDVPSIERRPLSGWPTFDNTKDRFAYEGQPLVFICVIGKAAGAAFIPCPSDEQFPGSVVNWRYYRLQVEGKFARFFLSPNGLTWLVQEKGGRTRVFGVGGVLESSPSHANLPQDGTDRESPQQVFRWRLVSDQDGHGNIAIYVWQKKGVRNLSYLTDIYDTPVANPGFGGLTVASYSHHTQLRWESAGTPIMSYAHIDRAVPDLRLVRVAVASTTWTGEGEREVIRAYTLSYMIPRGVPVYDPETQAPLLGHFFLKSVQMEGRCGKRELGGEISPVISCPQLPATRFTYQSGVIPPSPGLVTALSHVTGAPKDAVANSTLLADVRTSTVMDINRDGLPDIVQSWPANAVIDLTNHPKLRGQSALLNAGNDAVSVRFQHQCIDAGTAFGGIALHNLVQQAAFLSPFQGASVLGAWGDSLLLWNKVDYAPVALRPLVVPTDPQGQAAAIADKAKFCPAVTADPPDPNHPAWLWSPNSQLGWLRPANSPGGNQANRRWFVDVDGDGLPDLFSGVGGPAPQDLELSKVDFTRRVTGSDSPTGKPALLPFVSNLAPLAESLAPSSSARSNTKFFFADINGDGLVDLVLANPDDNGGNPRVRFGDGRGVFACVDSKQLQPCATGSPVDPAAMLIDVPDAQKPWPFVPDTYFHDVTGDGLADIVQLELGDGTGRVKLWINQNGRTFRCAAPENGCVVGRIFDDLHGTFTIQPARVTFADMNGNGVDDIVVLSGAGAMYLQVLVNSSVGSFAQARAPRPGLLIRLDNGRGATREIEYQTIQELDLASSQAGDPWHFHSPQVVPVVTGVAIRNTETATKAIPVKQPFLVNRWTSYSYRDPAYDLWARRFLGFRKVTKQRAGENSRISTTYVFGPCQREIPDCPDSSDDDGFKAMTGRIARVEQYIPAFNGVGKLSVIRFDYANGSLFTANTVVPGLNVDDRHVWFAYPSSRTTFLFDDQAPSTAGPSFQVPGSPDLVDGTPAQKGSPRILETMTVDRHGEVTESIQHGRISETLQDIDEPLKTTVTPLDCTATWKCRAAMRTTEVPGSFNRQSRYTYNATEDLSDVESLLQGSAQLQRKPASPGGAVARVPAAASADGWRKVLHLDYDAKGNVITAQGPGAPEPCIQVTFDDVFQQFPRKTTLKTQGCAAAAALNIQREFDRGTGQMTREVAPNGGVTTVEFDGFGRPHLLSMPKTDAMTGATVLTQRITFNDAGPLYWQMTEEFTDNPSAPLVTMDYPNALGESILTFRKADPAAGDPAPWVMSGAMERNQAGRIARLRRAAFFTDDPLNAGNILSQFQAPAGGVFDITYDDYGRTSQVSENQNPIAHYRYKPLQSEMQDAEQLKAGGAHASAFSRSEMDGHGRTIRSSQVIQGDTLQTEWKYLASGEPVRIVQSHAAGAEQVVRTMEYDSFGRLVRNIEPNTSTASGGLLTYLWDDAGNLVATSDARGCGKNRFYDGLGRLLAEDYSPCLPEQPAYTEPDLTTGDGTEAFFRYDVYEPGQLSSAPGFADAPENPAGMLTASINRGAYTRFNYDSRGNLRLESRRMAKPGEPESTLATRFSSHEFLMRSDYDLADRLVRQTTGADVDGLLAGGASEERYEYSARGLPTAFDSSYGKVSTYTRYDAEGLLQERILGDAAHTKETTTYDEKKRLSSKKTERLTTPVWTTLSPTYSLPGAATTQLQLENLLFAYDDAGNPTTIADLAASGPWPDGAKPITHISQFDDLYRLKDVKYAYADNSVQVSPFASESASGDTGPIPLQSSAARVREQSFQFDWKGNVASTADDRSLLFDRSLGKIKYNDAQGKPNQIESAGDGAMRAKYDDSGNMVDLVVERNGTCPVGKNSLCAQRFSFDWDEVGQLIRGRRWDFTGPALPKDTPVYPKFPPSEPAWDIKYAYSNGARVLQSITAAAGEERHSVDVFESLRLEGTTYDPATREYVRSDAVETASLGGIARIINAPGLPSPDGSPLHVLLSVADQLGSTSHVIDAKSGEVVERASYHAYGATESDYRPERWKSFREAQKYSDKEDDEKLGLTYFGARYYHPRLGQWISPDPLTIHEAEGDLNPYAFLGGRVLQDTDAFGLEGEPSLEDVQRQGCIGPEVCLPPPPDDLFNEPKPEPRPDPSPPGPTEPEPPKPEIGTVDQILSVAKDLTSRFADFTIGSPEGTHIRVGNVWKESFNLAIDDSVILAALGRVVTGSDVKFNVKGGEGDVSAVGPLVASLIIPAGGAAKIAADARAGRAFEKVALKALGTEKFGEIVGRLPWLNKALNATVLRGTIPDAVSKVAVAEVKNTAVQSLTWQLRRQIAYANAEKLTYVLITKMQTRPTAPLLKEIKEINGIIVKFDPLTGAFHAAF